MIHHEPIFNIEKICEHYSNQDGVPVKYVCTSATNEYATFACDVFYRETPHPEFGNHYFGLFFRSTGSKEEQRQVLITNADKIEDLKFGMIEGPEGWEYSQHRHDYRQVGNCAVDGGRAYFRRVGKLDTPAKYMKIVDGEFVEMKEAEEGNT